MAQTRPTISRERALAHDSRVALLAALQDSAQPLDVVQLARSVGLHINTVRSHLSLLERAGLVERQAELRTEPGRPRQLYSAAAPERPPVERYELMARMLASYIATSVDDPSQAAEETGRQWGRHLTPAPQPFAATTAEEGRAALLALLDDLGFSPREGVDPHQIELCHCPFLEVARAHPEVACSLHLGLMRGAMVQLQAPLSVDDLIPFVDAQRCTTTVSEVPWVTIAYVVLFVAFLDNFAMLPTVAPYAEQLGARFTGVGVAVGAYSLTNLLCNLLGGVLADRVGRRRLVVTSLVLVSAAMLCYPLVRSLEALVAVRLLHGAAGGVLVPTVFAVLGDGAPVAGRGRAMGRAGAVIGAAAVVAPAVAGGVRQAAGFTAVFVLVAVATALGAVVAQRGLPGGAPVPDLAPPWDLRGMLRRPGLRLACVSAFAFTGAIGSLAAFLPVHAADLGLPESATGGLFTVFAVVAVALMLSRAAGLVERRGAGRPIATGFTVLAAALGTLALGPAALPTTVAVAVFGVGYGMVFPAMGATVGAAAGPAERGTAYGLFMAFFSLGFVVIPPLGGAVADRWPALGPFAVATAVCLIGAARALVHRPPAAVAVDA